MVVSLTVSVNRKRKKTIKDLYNLLPTNKIIISWVKIKLHVLILYSNWLNLNLFIFFLNIAIIKGHEDEAVNSFFTNEVPELLVALGLLPVLRPAHHHSIVLQTPKSSNLDQVWCPISHVGGDDHLRETFHPLCLHQLTQRLQTKMHNWKFHFGTENVGRKAVYLSKGSKIPDLPSGLHYSCQGKFLEQQYLQWSGLCLL